MATMAGGMDANASAACLVDADCPGQLLCYKDVGWAPGEPPFCDCSTWYGRSGPPDCQQLNVNGWAMMVLTSLNLVAAGVYALWSLHDARMAVFVLGGTRGSAVNQTILIVSIALVAQTLWAGLYLVEMLMATRSDFVLALSTGEKRSPINRWVNLSVLVVQTATAVALINTSLVWIEVGSRVQTFAVKAQRVVSRYRVVCIVASSVFATTMVVTAAIGHMSLTTLLAIPFMLVTAVFYAVGHSAFQRLLESTDRMGVSERVKRAKRSIKRCNTRVLVGMLAVTVAGALYAMTTSDDWKSAAPQQGITKTTITYQLVPITMLQLQRTLFLYCHDNIKVRLGLLAQRANMHQHRGVARVDPGTRSSTSPRSTSALLANSAASPASSAASPDTHEGLPKPPTPAAAGPS